MKRTFMTLMLSSVVLFFHGFDIPAFCEEPVSLQKASEIFCRHNFDLLWSRFEIDKATGDYLAARAIPNPTFSSSYTAIEIGDGKLHLTDSCLLNLRLDQLLEMGGKRKKRVRAAQYALESITFAHQDNIRKLLASFFVMYHTFLQDEWTLEFYQQELTDLNPLLAFAETKYAEKNLTAIDYIKLHVSQIALETALADAENQVKNDREDFNFLLGGAGNYRPVRPHLEDENFPSFSEAALLARAQNRADFRSTLSQVKAAEWGLKFEQSRRIPDICVGLEYDFLGARHLPAIGVGIALDLPLFDLNKGPIFQRKAELDQAKTNADMIQKQIAVDIRQALNDYEASLKTLEAYKKRKEELLQLKEKSREAFIRGELPVPDFLESMDMYRNFMINYATTLIQCRLNHELVRLHAGDIRFTE
ncbi:MAG: TolC family protein [Candidatus Omnitrophota bacterium]